MKGQNLKISNIKQRLEPLKIEIIAESDDNLADAGMISPKELILNQRSPGAIKGVIDGEDQNMSTLNVNRVRSSKSGLNNSFA